jgi:hypothetical protein
MPLSLDSAPTHEIKHAPEVWDADAVIHRFVECHLVEA